MEMSVMVLDQPGQGRECPLERLARIGLRLREPDRPAVQHIGQLREGVDLKQVQGLDRPHMAARDPRFPGRIKGDAPGGQPLTQGQEVELYDYSTHGGRLELENGAGSAPSEGSLRSRLQRTGRCWFDSCRSSRRLTLTKQPHWSRRLRPWRHLGWPYP